MLNLNAILHSSRFLFRLQFCSCSNFDRIINDRQMLLNHVKKQSKLGFFDLKSPLSLFHQLASLHPLPSVIVFSMLFSSMAKLKHLQPHSTIITLFNQLQSSGIRHDMHSICILINCYCHLGHINLGLSHFGKSIELGFPLDPFICNTLLNGFINWISGKTCQPWVWSQHCYIRYCNQRAL